MRMAADWVWRCILDATSDAGFDDLNPAHVGLFRYPGPDGRRPSEVAAHLLITKQSVNDLLGHLEDCGYLRREPDPDDRRARIIRLTRSGKRLVAVVRTAAQQCEADIADVLGPERFAEFRSALETLEPLTSEVGSSTATVG
jgi:DNA-binding MarR family transcriptional regulator